MNKTPSVAIDGPAGAGKSTTARMVAKQLGIVYVDSGAMYRAVAWKCREAGVALSDNDAISEIARALDISFQPAVEDDGPQRVFANGVDITGVIRDPIISQWASAVSTIAAVREVLVAKQRRLGEAGGVVMEGRDIGTVVLPNAACKIFLTASLDERARRRHAELDRRGDSTPYETVRADIEERDRRDTTRTVSPLKPADDSMILDSEHMSADQVVGSILDHCRRQAGGLL
jgi:cytidylate kinase